MSLNNTPSGERIHIGFFGRRNAGKSSLINAFTGQDLSIVSDYKGTTTDPVSKSMELLPLGPVTVIDTPGIDDEGELGELRIKKCLEVLRRVHVAIVVIDVTEGLCYEDISLIGKIKEREVPVILVVNKSDKVSSDQSKKVQEYCAQTLNIEASEVLLVSATNRTNIEELKETVAKKGITSNKERSLLPEYVKAKDVVILVTPIDSSAPKGRVILPQQQVLRALLDINAKTVVVQPEELAETIELIGSSNIRCVITDSQAFAKVNEVVADRIPLTSFSILMAKYKGDYDWQLKGAIVIDNLTKGDKVLIAEGCTHHRQCEDIGTVKLPNWITKKCGEGIQFDFLSGGEFKSIEELNDYKLVIQCGGCMLNENEMRYRVNTCKEAGVPITNYGMAIAKLHGILDVVMKY